MSKQVDSLSFLDFIEKDEEDDNITSNNHFQKINDDEHDREQRAPGHRANGEYDWSAAELGISGMKITEESVSEYDDSEVDSSEESERESNGSAEDYDDSVSQIGKAGRRPLETFMQSSVKDLPPHACK